MNKKLLLILCMGAILLSACVHQPPTTQPQNQHLSLAERTKQLKAVQQWLLSGAVSVTEGKQHFQANVRWEQRALNHYTLRFFGPLGLGSTRLESNSEGISLTNADGHTITANTPEALITQQLNITLPVSDLQYWIRGLPSPHGHYRARYDAYNHITELQQAGWAIRYTRYQFSHQTDLPRQMQMQQGDIRVKMLISRWQ